MTVREEPGGGRTGAGPIVGFSGVGGPPGVTPAPTIQSIAGDRIIRQAAVSDRPAPGSIVGYSGAGGGGYGQAPGGSVVDPANGHLVAFGDSITQFGTGGSSTTLRASYTNLGQIEIAQARLNFPIAYENYADATGFIPAVAGNSVKYSLGDNWAQAGGDLEDAEWQIEAVRKRGLNPSGLILAIGTNDTGWATQNGKDRHYRLIDRMSQYWPNAKLLICLPPPSTRPHVAGAATDIDANITTALGAGKNVVKVDLFNAYGGTATSTDFQGDLVHPNSYGASTKGAKAYYDVISANFTAGTPERNAELTSLLPDAIAHLNGASTPISLAANTPSAADGVGTISGNIHAGFTLSKQNQCHCAVVCSLDTHPVTGLPCQKFVFTTPASGGGSETWRIKTSIGSIDPANTYEGNAWRDTYVHGRAAVRDNQRSVGSDVITQIQLAVAEASAPGTTYTDAIVPLYALNRPTDYSYPLTPPFKGIGGSTGLQLYINVTIDSTILNKSVTLWVDEFGVFTRSSPENASPFTDPNSYDTDAQAYFDAVGVRHLPTRAAINTLVAGLKSDGLWTLIDAICPIANWSTQAGYANLKNPAKSLVSQQVMDWHKNTGVKGAGVTNSHLIYATGESAYNGGVGQFQQDSASVFSYCTEDVGSGEGWQVGTNNNSPNIRIRPVLGSNDQYCVNCTTSITVANPGTRAGFRHVSRTASNLMVAYRNGAPVGSSTTASAAPGTQQIQILRSNAGGPSFYGIDRLGLVGWGAGMDATQAANLYARVNTFITAMAALS